MEGFSTVYVERKVMASEMIVHQTSKMYERQLVNFVREAVSELKPKQYFVHQVLAGLLDEILMHRKMQDISPNESPDNFFDPGDT
jgi:hypothetical protein